MNATVSSDSSGQTKQRLLLATERLVVSEGVHALTVRRIAAEAQVNSALIRYHFSGTDGLLRELARLNAACLDDRRRALLDALDERGEPDFEAAVDALVLPLWASAALSPGQRAIVVLDEIFSRAGTTLQQEVWATFAEGVRRVTQALRACLPDVDEEELAWRIRFVTAAALDVPPRSPRLEEARSNPIYGKAGPAERLAHFRSFAQQALKEI